MSASTVPPVSPIPSPVSRLSSWLRALGSPSRAVGLLVRRIPRSGWRTGLLVLALIAVGALLLADPLRSWRYFPPRSGRAVLTTPAVSPSWKDEHEGPYRSANDDLLSRGADRPEQLGGSPAGLPDKTHLFPWGRQIIRRANLEVELAHVDRGIVRLTEIIEAAGGYVADMHARTDNAGTVRATITAYVPPDRFGPTIANLEDLGRPTSRRISGQDVSEEFVDLQARVRNLERHEGQLLSFMSKAQKVTDLLTLENELARVRGEIERLSGRMRFLKARTEMAAIQIGLVRAPLVAPSDDALARVWERIRGAFRDAWIAAFGVAAGLVVLAAQMSPLAVPALATWALYRRWARRRVASHPTTGTGG